MRFSFGWFLSSMYIYLEYKLVVYLLYIIQRLSNFWLWLTGRYSVDILLLLRNMLFRYLKIRITRLDFREWRNTQAVDRTLLNLKLFYFIIYDNNLHTYAINLHFIK